MFPVPFLLLHMVLIWSRFIAALDDLKGRKRLENFD
jgi:hypothetical protein